MFGSWHFGDQADTSFMKRMTIWANPFLAKPAKDYLIAPQSRIILSSAKNLSMCSILVSGDSRLLEADIAFGAARSGNGSLFKKITLDSSLQPPVTPPMTHLSSLRTEGSFWAILTNSSAFNNEPCAPAAHAWLLADARQLYPSYDNQKQAHACRKTTCERGHVLLADQTI